MIVLIVVQVLLVIVLLVFMFNNWFEYLKDKRRIQERQKNKKMHK